VEDGGVTDNWEEMLAMVIGIESCIDDDLRALSRHTLQKIDSEVSELREHLNIRIWG
jgi:hypothetical protein